MKHHALKTYGEWRYSSTILDMGTRWRCCQLHTAAALPPGKESPVPIGWEAGWALEPVCALWSREKSFTPARNRNPEVQPVAHLAIPTEISQIFSLMHNAKILFSSS
jgi:hypothetical protein